MSSRSRYEDEGMHEGLFQEKNSKIILEVKFIEMRGALRVQGYYTAFFFWHSHFVTWHVGVASSNVMVTENTRRDIQNKQ